MDITYGACDTRDPCTHNHCSNNEICAAMTYGPCLAVYTTDGRRLPCRQYICGQLLLLCHYDIIVIFSYIILL